MNRLNFLTIKASLKFELFFVNFFIVQILTNSFDDFKIIRDFKLVSNLFISLSNSLD